MKDFVKTQYVLPEIKVDMVDNDIITFSENFGDVDYPFIEDEE